MGNKEEAQRIEVEGKQKLAELNEERKRLYEEGRNAHYAVAEDGTVTMELAKDKEKKKGSKNAEKDNEEVAKEPDVSVAEPKEEPKEESKEKPKE